MPIVVIGLNHRTAPVAVRERFAFDDARIPADLQRLRESGVASEGVILSTCNRVELYAATTLEPREAFTALKEFLLNCHDFREPVSNELYTLAEPHSIEHLFKVASGLDSMVLGETEVFGQLKKAYDLALRHRHSGGLLNRVFQRAFNVAKHIRTETSIQRGSVSVGSVAVELAEKIFATLNGRHVMVLGAGDTSEKTARALLSRGVQSVIVSNRSYERAQALAAELGGRAVRYDEWAAEFPKVDVIISSTSAPHYIVERAKLEPMMKSRKGRPLLLIDIAVPSDIEPSVSSLENVYLYNIDDLQAIADDYLKQRQEEIARCEAVIRERVRQLIERIPGTADSVLRDSWCVEKNT